MNTPRLFLFAAALLTAAGAVSIQAQTLTLPHGGPVGDSFGASAALVEVRTAVGLSSSALLTGVRAAVGAPSHDSCGPSSGAVHLFEADSTGAWASSDTLSAPDCKPGMFFGRRIAMSGDLLIATASGDFFEGARTNLVYAFARDTSGVWRYDGRLAPIDGVQEGAFGFAVALDGNRAAVTASGDGDKGAYGGSIYIYERSPQGRWTRTARLLSPDRRAILGSAVALSGDLVVAAAPDVRRGRDGRAVAFRFDGQGWQSAGSVDGLDGKTLTIAAWGNRVAIGEPEARGERGRAFVYAWDGAESLERLTSLQPPTRYRGGRFGHQIALGPHHAAAAAYDEQIGRTTNVDRVVHVFSEAAGWETVQVADQGSAFFGSAVALGTTYLLTGEDDPQKGGSAYLITLRRDGRTAMER